MERRLTRYTPPRVIATGRAEHDVLQLMTMLTSSPGGLADKVNVLQ